MTVFISICGCNLKCKHCYANVDVEEHKYKTYDEVIALLEDIVLAKTAFSYIEVKFHHEPTLHKQFPELLEKLASLGLTYYGFPTNGFGLARSGKEKIISAAKKAGVKCVSFSLYGDELQHDAFTGVIGSYKTVMNAMEAVEAAGLNYIVQLFLTKENAGSINKMKGKFGDRAFIHLPSSSERLSVFHDVRATKESLAEADVSGVNFKTQAEWVDAIRKGQLKDYIVSGDDDGEMIMEYDSILYDSTNPIKTSVVGDLRSHKFSDIVGRRSLTSYFWDRFMDEPEKFLDISFEENTLEDDVVYEYWDILVDWLERDLVSDLPKYLKLLPLDKINLFFFDDVIFRKNDEIGCLEISRPGRSSIVIGRDDMLFNKFIDKERIISGNEVDFLPGSEDYLKFLNILNTFYENEMIYITI